MGSAQVLKFHKAYRRLDDKGAGSVSFERLLQALGCRRSPTIDGLFNIPGEFSLKVGVGRCQMVFLLQVELERHSALFREQLFTACNLDTASRFRVICLRCEFRAIRQPVPDCADKRPPSKRWYGGGCPNCHAWWGVSHRRRQLRRLLPGELAVVL